MRLGDNQTIPINVRIISASNMDLMEGVETGIFREDLYYRLNVMEIFIPPLRERKGDIKVMIDYMLNRLCKQMGISKPNMTEEIVELLNTYRQLENMIERALLLSGGETIKKEHLPARNRLAQNNQAKKPSVTYQEGFREIIDNALKQSNGNVSMAARQLKIARSTLYRKMREFGIP